MQPIADMPLAVARTITCVFADIDDTLTSEGRLPAVSYQALERLFEAGVTVVAITGRPAGWCDLIARLWPIHGVVGENGAFYFAYDSDARVMQRVFADSPETRTANRAALKKIADEILAAVPGAALSADQAYRETDLAIDICEDIPALTTLEVERILAIFSRAGATAKLSSVHVNGWFGRYDKLSMTKRFAEDVMHTKLDDIKSTVVFCGDSPNDVPMFGYFPHACGVANVLDFKAELDAFPAWITRARGGAGFAELAEVVLGARAS